MLLAGLWSVAELRQLRIIVTAADRGSFSSAAAQLNIEISAVSRSVRDLEESIGVAIFERLPRGVKLTAAGEAYVAAARDILARVAKANHDARVAGSSGVGALSLGFVWSFSLRPMTELLASYIAAYPAVMLNLVEDGHDGLLARVRSGELHVAFTATDPAPHVPLKSHDDLESMPLWLEQLAVAVSDKDQAESFSWSDLAGRWLLCRPNDDWRRFVAHVERVGGPTLQFIEQDVSGEGILALAGSGLGYGIVPASLAVPQSVGARLAPITSAGAVLQAEAVWRRRAINPTLIRFLGWSGHRFDPMSNGALWRNRDPSP
jgi:DNA-binding transcriptional LysR family regulator